MGVDKLGKKLVKVGRRARKTLGKRGKELAEAVLARAISILEAELKAAQDGKRPAAGKGKTDADKVGEPSAPEKGASKTPAAAPPRSRSGKARSLPRGSKPAAAAKGRKPPAARRRSAAVEGQAAAESTADAASKFS